MDGPEGVTRCGIPSVCGEAEVADTLRDALEL
jgi:hypothetical protein